jgi:DHA3 family macrolide efflux protein-like MFS transporter
MKRSWKRDVFFFLFSQGLSLFGSSLVQYALMWHITLKTKSGAMMTLFIICGFAPAFLLSPFAGVWADRYDRKKIIMLADGMIAAVTLALAAVFASGAEAFWLMFLAAALRAVGSAAQQPAVGAFLPQIAPKEALAKVNGLNASIQSAVMIASPLVSGALMTFAPLPLVFLIDVATAALAIAVLLVFLKVPPHAKAAEPQSVAYLADMRLGVGYIRAHPYLRRFFLYLAVLYVLVSPAAFLTPLQVARSFGDDVWRLMSIEVAFSGGMLLGGALLAAWGGFRNRMRNVVAGCAAMALCAVGLGLIPRFWPYIACMAVFGIALPFMNAPATALLQERVEEGYMGRVFSVLAMISSALMPMSMLAFGPLAEIVPIEWLLLGSGAVLMLMTILMSLDRILLPSGRGQDPAGE